MTRGMGDGRRGGDCLGAMVLAGALLVGCGAAQANPQQGGVQAGQPGGLQAQLEAARPYAHNCFISEAPGSSVTLRVTPSPGEEPARVELVEGTATEAAALCWLGLLHGALTMEDVVVRAPEVVTLTARADTDRELWPTSLPPNETRYAPLYRGQPGDADLSQPPGYDDPVVFARVEGERAIDGMLVGSIEHPWEIRIGFLVDQSGRVVAARAVSGSGLSPVQQEACLRIVRTWQFPPADRGPGPFAHITRHSVKVDGVAASAGTQTRDGSVRVPLATGGEWVCEEKSGAGGGAVVSSIFCDLKTPSGIFFMVAKTYTVPPDQVVPARQLVEEIYQRNYAKLFSSFAVEKTEPVTFRGQQAWDLWLMGQHPQVGPVRKHERVLVQGQRVFLLSAEGSPELFERMSAERARWFAGSQFTQLGR